MIDSFAMIQVEKQRMNMTMKTQQSEEAKTEYANQLQKTNDMQTLHYHTAMPEVFQHLQVLFCHNCTQLRPRFLLRFIILCSYFTQ